METTAIELYATLDIVEVYAKLQMLASEPHGARNNKDSTQADIRHCSYSDHTG